VQLQGDNSVLAPRLLVVVGHVDHCDAVDAMGEMVPLGDDVVLVPAAPLDGLQQLVAIAHLADHFRLMVFTDDHLVAALAKDAAALGSWAVICT